MTERLIEHQSDNKDLDLDSNRIEKCDYKKVKRTQMLNMVCPENAYFTGVGLVVKINKITSGYKRN